MSSCSAATSRRVHCWGGREEGFADLYALKENTYFVYFAAFRVLFFPGVLLSPRKSLLEQRFSWEIELEKRKKKKET